MFAKQTKGCLNSENLPTPQGARFRKLHARLWIFCNVNWFVGRAGACSRRKVPAFEKIHTRLNSYQTRGRNAQAHQRIVGNNLSVVPPKLYQTPRAIRESPLQRGAESTPPTLALHFVRRERLYRLAKSHQNRQHKIFPPDLKKTLAFLPVMC